MKLGVFQNILIIISVVILISCRQDYNPNSIEESEVAKNPNILFIFLDDMGYDDPQCYNPQSLIPTPNIDRLAKEWMKFTDAHTVAAV